MKGCAQVGALRATSFPLLISGKKYGLSLTLTTIITLAVPLYPLGWWKFWSSNLFLILKRKKTIMHKENLPRPYRYAVNGDKIESANSKTVCPTSLYSQTLYKMNPHAYETPLMNTFYKSFSHLAQVCFLHDLMRSNSAPKSQLVFVHYHSLPINISDNNKILFHL